MRPWLVAQLDDRRLRLFAGFNWLLAPFQVYLRNIIASGGGGVNLLTCIDNLDTPL